MKTSRFLFKFFCLFFISIFILSCSSVKYDEDTKISAGEEEDINGNFPEHVLVRSRTQSFNLYYEFILSEGKIYSKPVNDQNAQWSLFLNTGLPFYKPLKSNLKFSSPESIVEISADGDSLYVSDSQGFIYHVFLSNSSPEKPFIWKKGFGWPKKLPLQQNNLVSNNRGWAMGSRRKEVLWHDDIYGNPHHYGTMGLETIYFLTADGQHIRFTDSGLTVDFSRQIRVPENGQFISENIDVSADTIFLIGKNGTMYTRLIDFDTMGCDVMFFNYTYDKVEQKYTGYDYLSNYSPWALPAEQWKKHSIQIEGKGRLSKYITIIQNGHGNAARELRVAGLNSEGKTGYYYKNINDEKWNFVEADLIIPEASFLDEIKASAVNKTETGNLPEYKFSGYILKNNSRIEGIECSLSDMNLTSEEESFLKISNGRESFTTKIFCIEKWTAFRRYNTGFDGTPRNYFVTFEFDENELLKYSEEFSSVLKDMLQGKNHEAFNWNAEGTVSYFYFNGPGKEDKKSFIQNLNSSKYSICLGKAGTDVNHIVYKGSNYTDSDLLNKASSSKLLLLRDRTYTADNIKEIKDKIHANKKYLKELKEDLKQTRKSVNTSMVSNYSYDVADLVTRITFLNRISFPKIKQMTSHGRNLMLTNYEMYVGLAMYKKLGYKTVYELVDERIDAYSDLLSKIDDASVQARLPDSLRYTYQDYLKLVGLPSLVESASEKASLKMIDETPAIPGYIMTCEDDSFYFVLLKDAVDSCTDFFKKGKTVSAENPFAADIEMTRINIEKNSALLKNPSDHLKGKIYWDGTNFELKANDKIIFSNRTEN